MAWALVGAGWLGVAVLVGLALGRAIRITRAPDPDPGRWPYRWVDDGQPEDVRTCPGCSSPLCTDCAR